MSGNSSSSYPVSLSLLPSSPIFHLPFKYKSTASERASHFLSAVVGKAQLTKFGAPASSLLEKFQQVTKRNSSELHDLFFVKEQCQTCQLLWILSNSSGIQMSQIVTLLVRWTLPDSARVNVDCCPGRGVQWSPLDYARLDSSGVKNR